MNWLAVFVGGGCGASLRYALVQVIGPQPYPLATQLANVGGSLLIGLAYVGLTSRFGSEHPVHQLLIVGLLGGFTTYSSFSLDALRLMMQGRHGLAAIYVLSTVALCLLGAGLGLAVGRKWLV